MRPRVIFAILLSLPTWVMSCFNSNKVTSAPGNNAEGSAKLTAMSSSFHTLSAKTLDGQTISMDQYKGKKIIVLNVASECGYTPQYADWQAFYEKNKDKVVVLGFPCNQFGGQESGSATQIQQFCQKNYGVTFQMFEKVDVKGNDQSPLYKWLTDPSQNGWNSDVPSWNFCKYLIDEEGKLTHFFASGVTPESADFKKAMD
ncbi:glutathione peroxidase [Haliscomenobacter sp.]|uniref:glutathione peroxidase n=1 Tax=Haliscomenobacter sp. TaxID=2717303 RepID=UPI0035932358